MLDRERVSSTPFIRWNEIRFWKATALRESEFSFLPKNQNRRRERKTCRLHIHSLYRLWLTPGQSFGLLNLLMAFLLLGSAVLHITSLINGCFQQCRLHRVKAEIHILSWARDQGSSRAGHLLKLWAGPTLQTRDGGRFGCLWSIELKATLPVRGQWADICPALQYRQPSLCMVLKSSL